MNKVDKISHNISVSTTILANGFTDKGSFFFYETKISGGIHDGKTWYGTNEEEAMSNHQEAIRSMQHHNPRTLIAMALWRTEKDEHVANCRYCRDQILIASMTIETVTDECLCSCHHNKGILHCFPCCYDCPDCNKRIQVSKWKIISVSRQ